jgi:dTDP-4-amino-4,6-dideoxygalactose transaminase
MNASPIKRHEKHASEIRMQEIATAAKAAALETLDALMSERAALLASIKTDATITAESARLTRVAAKHAKLSDTLARRRYTAARK